jgi:hypothetical protein
MNKTLEKCCNECSSDPHGVDYSYKEHCTDKNCHCHSKEQTFEERIYNLSFVGDDAINVDDALTFFKTEVSELLGEIEELKAYEDYPDTPECRQARHENALYNSALKHVKVLTKQRFGITETNL